jgi:hypothetical protein
VLNYYEPPPSPYLQVVAAQERLKKWYMEENRRMQASRGNP